MSEAQLVWMAAGIVFFIGGVNIALTLYTWTLLKETNQLLKSNVYLNIEALDLIHYGISRGYEKGIDDALKKIAGEGANLG